MTLVPAIYTHIYIYIYIYDSFTRSLPSLVHSSYIAVTRSYIFDMPPSSVTHTRHICIVTFIISAQSFIVTDCLLSIAIMRWLPAVAVSPVNSPHKSQWRGALMFSLICVWINDWVNNCEAGDLRRYRAHYDVIVMSSLDLQWVTKPLLESMRAYFWSDPWKPQWNVNKNTTKFMCENWLKISSATYQPFFSEL